MAEHTGVSPSDELRNWCRGEGLDLKHAFMLTGVPEDTDIAYIEENVQAVKALGRVRVRGKRFDPQQNSLVVLCASREVVDPTRIPPEIVPSGGGPTWKVIISDEFSNSADGFDEKLFRLLKEEGKTLGDISTLHAKSTPQVQVSSPESIIRAVSDLLEKTAKPHSESHAYKRLRIFSGTSPTPAGEENLENWLEQAKLMVEESNCSDGEKRRRIVESLKGSALEIFQAVKVADPQASPVAYIEAIESSFGSMESGEDLYFAYRTMQQQSGERLSDFLRRLDRSLTKIVQRGGLPAALVDQARVEQLLRGAVDSDLMLIHLRLRERKNNPPTFLKLLNEIKEEEQYEATRQKMNTPSRRQHIRTVHACEERSSEIDELKELRTDIKKWITKAGEQTDKLTKTPTTDTDSRAKEKLTHPEHESEVQMLKRQVQELQSQLTVMAVQQVHSTSYRGRSFKQSSDPPGRELPRERGELAKHDTFFCYRCGEDGHIATKCKDPENLPKVIQKLIRALHTRSTEKKEPKRNPSDKNCAVKKSLVKTMPTSSLPQGLVGPSSTIPVKVAGHSCQALLDSGSQVTIVFESWYSRHLSHIPLHPVTGLAIWGLSESSYPYRGYIVVDFEFPKELSGDNQSISVLALVCPEPQTSDHIPVIIGTNANLFKRLAQLCQGTADSHQSHSFRVQPLLSPVLHSNQSCKQDTDGLVGKVKWLGPGPLTLAPRVESYVTCSVEPTQSLSKEILLVETPSSLNFRME
uniref:CCHC-type domain-containing protein n=1 Tax=Astyanax mexicanus TaxID=7994 RepID=A0A3B1JFJ8_ASTMX